MDCLLSFNKSAVIVSRHLTQGDLMSFLAGKYLVPPSYVQLELSDLSVNGLIHIRTIHEVSTDTDDAVLKFFQGFHILNC